MVILESTTYPGTTEELLVPLLERESRLSAASDFFVGYSPERIDPGSARWQLTSIPKPVSELIRITGGRPTVYTTMVDQTVVAAGVRRQNWRSCSRHFPPRQHRPRQRSGHVCMGLGIDM